VKPLFFLALLVILVTACNSSPRRYSGHYIHGGEVETFQPCGSEKVYWVRGSIKLLGELRESHRELTDKPYQGVYVEMTGELGPRATEGFPAEYDGQFMIGTIKLIRASRADDCEG
jgi:hypothetical protein